jgi:SAM-dependent methyltransferase
MGHSLGPRAADGYLETWIPRFLPYHLDLVRELSIPEGARVLVTSSGPGGNEVLAVARAVGREGRVLATDASARMVEICREQVEKAGFSDRVTCAQADAGRGPRWAVRRESSVRSASGKIVERELTLRSWARGLKKGGKVGVVAWGPAEVDDPFEQMRELLLELEPDVATHSHRVLASRESMAKMFSESELSMVRHTVIRHSLTFATAEAFVTALRESCTWRRVWETLGDERLARVAARFYDRSGGPLAPLTFSLRPPSRSPRGRATRSCSASARCVPRVWRAL